MFKITWKLPAKKSITSKTAGIVNQRMNFPRTCSPFKNTYILDILVPVWLKLILLMDIILDYNFIQ